MEQANSDFSMANCLDYRTGKSGAAQFSAGDYIISAQQPRHLLVHSILDRNLAIEDSVMYDMATWSAPLAYNLEAYSSTAMPKVATTKVGALEQKGSLDNTALEGQPAYAYLIDWQQRWAPKALGQLWEKGYRVRSAVAPFSNGKATYSAGTLIVLRGRNLEKEGNLAEDLSSIAASCGVNVTALPTGRMSDGFDLASSRNRPVEKPRIAMLVEPPFDTYSSGQVYFLFDQETAFPIDRIRTSAFTQTSLPKLGQRYGYADINDYDVLILPDGGDLQRIFWQDQRLEINQWLQRGGTLIALEESGRFFTTEGKFGKLEMVKSTPDTSDAAKYLTYAEQESYRGLKRIPGSALRTTIDTTHPLAFGVKPEVYGLKLNTYALEPAIGLESVGTYHQNPSELLTAGYASTANLERLAGKTFAGVQRIGEGKVVYLLDNPHYRMFWRGTSRMMQNAAFLLPGF